MKIKKFVFPLIFILLFISILAPLSVSADNGGVIWSDYGWNSKDGISLSDPFISPGENIQVNFNGLFWSFHDTSFIASVVPNTNFIVGSNYFDSMIDYNNNNCVASAVVPRGASSVSISSDSLPGFGNYILYVYNVNTQKAFSYYFTYYNALYLDKNLTPDTFKLTVSQLDNSFNTTSSFTTDVTSSNLGLNYFSIMTWQADYTSFGRLSVDLDDINIDANNDFMFIFDDFSISRLNEDAEIFATYLIYPQLVNNITGQTYQLAPIDNLHSSTANPSPYYFIIPYDVFNGDFSNFSLEFSYRIRVTSTVSDLKILKLNIKNLRFVSIKSTTLTSADISDSIVDALNDPSFGTFTDNFPHSEASSSSDNLESSVDNYVELEESLLDSVNVDTSYYGEPAADVNVVNGIMFWSHIFTNIYDNVDLIRLIIGLSVTTGVLALLINIHGSVVNMAKSLLMRGGK